jgi:putative ABC transport system permease protein
VVGVVGNIRQSNLGDTSTLQVYAPYSQEPFIFATLVVRTRGDALAMTRAVQQAVWAADKDQPMWKIRTLQSLVDHSFSLRRYVAWLVGGFSALALLLATIGLYGLLAYTVGQRTSEFGVRLAIGATPSDLRRLVLRRGLRLTVSGLVVGVAASVYLMRFLQTQVYEVSTTDPRIYAALCAVLLVVALPAMLLPARRAMRTDPVTALRQE